MIADDTVWELISETVETSFGSTDGTFDRARFRGECSTAEIDRLTDAAAEAGSDVIVGIGGGKSLDTAKSVAARLDLPVGSVPTVASNDSPTSSISIIYGDDGALADAEQHGRHPSSSSSIRPLSHRPRPAGSCPVSVMRSQHGTKQRRRGKVVERRCSTIDRPIQAVRSHERVTDCSANTPRERSERSKRGR